MNELSPNNVVTECAPDFTKNLISQTVMIDIWNPSLALLQGALVIRNVKA